METTSLADTFLNWDIQNHRDWMYAMIGLVVLDYITGLCVAVKEKKISSKIGMKGIARKVMIFALIALSVILDQFFLQSDGTVSTATILFYCTNELISILENAKRMGVPLPEKLLLLLEQLKIKK